MKQSQKNPPIALASYEDFGSDYANVINGNAYNAHYERPSTIALMPDLKGKRVLDAGCGPGAYTEWLLQCGASVVGVDVSPAMLKVAQEKYGSQARFHLQDLSLPMEIFTPSSFDLILASLSVHYIQDIKGLFKEFHRLLSPAGHVVFSTHHPMVDFESSINKNYFDTELLEQEWNTVGRPVTVRFYRRPLQDFFSAFAEAGFIVETVSEGVLNKELEEKFPKTFARLSAKPGFLFFRLRRDIPCLIQGIRIF